MIKILANIFIKNNSSYKDPHVRENYGVLCGLVGIFLNVVLFAGKFLAGTLSGAISITADAFNNLSDAGSSFITMIGFKLAGQKPDAEHPFGHGRMEYLSGIAVSVIIILMAWELLKNSIAKILNPSLPEFSLLIVIILVASIVVKLYMAFYNSGIGKKIDSAAMAATAKDSLSDSIATGVVLVSAFVGYYFKIPIDGYCGLLVALMILWAGISAMKETIGPLLGQAPEQEFVDEIEKIVFSYDKIIGIHDLVVHDYGPGRLMISLHAEVPYNEDILEMHDIIDRIEFDLRGMLNCEPVIHMDPIVTDDEDTNRWKEIVKEVTEEIDSRLKFHDFRVVKGPTHNNLIFDVVAPHKFELTDNELKEAIFAKVHGRDETLFTVVQVDRMYTKE